MYIICVYNDIMLKAIQAVCGEQNILSYIRTIVCDEQGRYTHVHAKCHPPEDYSRG